MLGGYGCLKESTENKTREDNILEDSQSLRNKLMDLYSNGPVWKVFLTSSALIVPICSPDKEISSPC